MRTSPITQEFVTGAAKQHGYDLESLNNMRLVLGRKDKGPLIVEVLARNVVAISDFHDPEDGVIDHKKDWPFISCEYFTGKDGWILTRVWPAHESVPETFANVAPDGNGWEEIPYGTEQAEATRQIEEIAKSWQSEGVSLTGKVESSLG